MNNNWEKEFLENLSAGVGAIRGDSSAGFNHYFFLDFVRNLLATQQAEFEKKLKEVEKDQKDEVEK